MGFILGCLTIIIIALSLVIGAYHAGRSDYPFVHWLLGFCAGVVAIVFIFLGFLFD